MKFLPKLLYVMQVLPINLLRTFRTQLISIFKESLWAGKQARISIRTLSYSKEHGAIGFPDPARYYLAVHLNRVVDWARHEESKLWVGLEKDSIDLDLKHIPWIPSKLTKEIKVHPTVMATWRAA